MSNEKNSLISEDKKIENFKGLTFINTYNKEDDATTINRFKKDVFEILRNLTPVKNSSKLNM